MTTRPTFTFGSPVPLPRFFLDRGPRFERGYDITLDGKQFLGVVASAAAPPIQVVLNWTEELKARVPVK